jgi:hypothetical protein
MAEEMTFVAAMRDYFNARPSLSTGEPIKQTPSHFLQEMKALTAEDKAWYKANLATVGYTITN